MQSERTLRLVVVLLLLVGAGHAVAHAAPFEDAYITYRYAEHLAAGLGPVYNVGERVEGCTSLGWTVLLGAVASLRLPLGPVSQLFSLVGGLWLAWATLGISRSLVARHPLDPWQLLPAAGVMASGTWAYYAGSGMETTTFAALVTSAAWLAIRAQDRRSAIIAGLLLALAAMLRPEGVGYALAILVAVLSGESRRDAIRMGSSFAAMFLPFFAGRWCYFGHPLPNTYYAKASPSLAVFVAGVVHSEAFLTSHAFWLPFAAAVGLGVSRRQERAPRIVAALVLAALANAVFVGGDTFAYYRLFLPALPAGAVALVMAARALGDRWAAPRGELAGASLVVTWIAMSFVAQFLPTRTLLERRAQSEWARVSAVGRINADYFAVGAWLRQHADPRSLLAVNAAGIVPYASGLRTLDMLGLNDEHIARRPLQLGHGVVGHEKHDAGYVLSRRPDIVLLGLPVLAPRQLRPGELEVWFGRWFPYLPGDRELFESAEFRRVYSPVSVPVGEKYLVCFLRHRGAAPE
jgi:arabinofuranosyltransferase